MKRTLIYATAFTLATAASVSPGFATARNNDGSVPPVDNNIRFYPERWRLVKQAFQIHLPQNSNALAQLIINTPSTVAVSNDINVLDDNGQKININVSALGRRIIINFPETVISNTNLLIELNKVKQPIFGPTSVYSISAKVVGSDVEIPVGVAQFTTF